MISYGCVEHVNLMKRVYYATIALVIPIMRVMMLHFIMLRLEGAVIVEIPMRGIQRGE